MNTNDYISVIIPVHNTEPYLKRCVESVRNQTHSGLEIILVENCSTDRSAEICDEYAKLDSRIKVLHLDIADLSTARNEGLKIAMNSFIGFIDSDDFIESDMYEVLLKNLKKYDADISMCAYSLDYENGKSVKPASSQIDVKVYSGVEALKGVLMEELSNASWDKLYRRELFDEVQFPKGYYYEDHFTMLKWFQVCSKIVYTPVAYYHYWQRDDSICHDFNPTRGYHHFLADFYRWEYVVKTKILEGRERKLFLNRTLYRCYFNFRQIISSIASLNDFASGIEDMRAKLKMFYSESCNDLYFKNHLRLLKTTYLWKVYYFATFSFRK